ncbi:uncharacterized protein LOC115574549 isoform X2 [Sparus aurata]|uniref:uncharacterized protein LOC115574549 isoform X2 n=1 Tax=Sparus aurata TaxID=8175 RepID=UPI0011C149E9|nr:uncharacterized protein LOC115574549 isoform X2 [Sparus aurata]
MIIRRETEEGERQRIMMVQFKWILMSLFVTAMLQFTGAAENLPASFTVTVGDDVTLTCENMIKPQQRCNSTIWIFSGLGNKQVVELVGHGEIDKDVKAEDRLSVTENCSLVIKNVTVEDVGLYVCQQYKSRGAQSSSDSVVYLSVVSMTEHQNHDKVTLICSVSTYGPCSHTVKWLFEGKEVDKDNRGVTTSQCLCSASVRAPSSHHIYKSEFEFVKCSVTDGDKEQQLFPFRLQSSGNKPGEETTTTTTTESSYTSRTERTNTTGSGTDGASSEPQSNWWWLLIILAVVLVAFLIIVVKVIRRKRAEGESTENNTRMEDNVVSIISCTDVLHMLHRWFNCTLTASMFSEL